MKQERTSVRAVANQANKRFLLLFFKKEDLPTRIMHRLLLALLIFAATSARAQEEPPPNPLLLPPAPTHEEVAHLAGDSDRPVDLVTTLYYPEGPGPFPLAIVNHGANDVQEKPAEVKRHRFTYLAYYFLSRGYAVALPMMRGYGGSSGSQTRHHCDLDEVALDNGRDIAGVIAALTPFVRIDPTRIVVAGQSYGGWNTLGLGALDPPPANVRGLVNFSRAGWCPRAAWAAMGRRRWCAERRGSGRQPRCRPCGSTARTIRSLPPRPGRRCIAPTRRRAATPAWSTQAPS